MARARNIKPGFFTNDELAQCEYGARLLFAGLWTIADREGRLEDKPLKIKALLFPFDNCDANAWLTQLAACKFITRYEVDGCKFIQVNNFTKHQNPHIKEAASTIPAPCSHGSSTILAGLNPSPSSMNPSPSPSNRKNSSRSHAAQSASADAGDGGGGEIVSSNEADGDWRTIATRLRSLGLSDADACLSVARKRGTTPGEINAIIDHWETHRGAWTAGMLHYRVKTSRPGEEASSCWPTPIAEFKQAKASEAKKAKPPSKDLYQKRADAKSEAAKIEAEFGTQLDAMSSQELESLAAAVLAGNSMMLKKFEREGVKSALVREMLLRHLAKGITV